LKITQNHAKLSQEHSKNLQNTLFLKIPKWLSISEPSDLAHAKKKRKNNTKSRRDGTRIFGVLKNKAES
jgi:hypothetical protein